MLIHPLTGHDPEPDGASVSVMLCCPHQLCLYLWSKPTSTITSLDSLIEKKKKKEEDRHDPE